MKQKIVIKVQMRCDKCRSKAMTLVASTSGVESMEITGEDRNHLVVVGDGVDSVGLTSSLRKKLGNAQIVKVEQVIEGGKPEMATTDEATTTVTAYPLHWRPPAVVYPYHPGYYDYEYSNPDRCSIM